MQKTVHYLLLIFFVGGCGTSESKKDAQTASGESKPTETVKTKTDKKTILFFGNSITAGYQLDMEQAFPALLQKKMDSLGYEYQAINAGLSGETSAGGNSRIEWVLRTVPDIFFLELGANDGLRGLPVSETEKNLQSIIDQVKAENPEVKIIIAGMMVPPNMGKDYSYGFEGIFERLAKKNDATLIPFVLDKVAGIPELNLPDGIHPTSEGHQLVAETVWEYLAPLL